MYGEGKLPQKIGFNLKNHVLKDKNRMQVTVQILGIVQIVQIL